VLTLVHPIDLLDDTIPSNVWTTLVQQIEAEAPGGLVTLVAILSSEPWAGLLRSLGVPDRLGEEDDFFVLQAEEMIEGVRSIANFAASRRGTLATADYRVHE